MALGAFLGGLVLAESEFSHQAHAEIRPLRDILAGLFFISLGMLVDLGASASSCRYRRADGDLLVALKAWRRRGLLRPRRSRRGDRGHRPGPGRRILVHPRPDRLEVGLLSAGAWQLLLAASIATMVVTPALLRHRAARRLVAGGEDEPSARRRTPP